MISDCEKNVRYNTLSNVTHM
eukprot:COSAG01_NODE_59630_length_299_cov_0.810000_1_plen_20_part_01